MRRPERHKSAIRAPVADAQRTPAGDGREQGSDLFGGQGFGRISTPFVGGRHIAPIGRVLTLMNKRVRTIALSVER